MNQNPNNKALIKTGLPLSQTIIYQMKCKQISWQFSWNTGRKSLLRYFITNNAHSKMHLLQFGFWSQQNWVTVDWKACLPRRTDTMTQPTAARAISPYHWITNIPYSFCLLNSHFLPDRYKNSNGWCTSAKHIITLRMKIITTDPEVTFW